MVTTLTKTQGYFYDMAIKLGIMLPTDVNLPQFAQKANNPIRYLQLSYTEEEIFNEVQKRTYFIARSRVDSPEKEHLLQQIAFTQDEKEMFDPYMQQAVQDLLDILSPFNRNINAACLDRAVSGVALWNATTAYVPTNKVASNGLVYECLVGNTNVTPVVGTNWKLSEDIYTDDKLVLFVETYTWMNINTIHSVDTTIFESLVTGIMANWFIIASPADAVNYIALHGQKQLQVTRALNSSGPWKRQYKYP